MLPRVILLLGVLAVGCFSEAPMDPASTSGTETGQPTTTTTAPTATDTTADTTAGDPLAACRECQVVQCEAQASACSDAAGCDICVDTPFDIGCLTNETFRPLAHCSCDKCADECGYMCPGGGDACQACVLASTCDVGPCGEMIECLPCLEDPYSEGCSTNPTAMELGTCICTECEAECLWQCPGAVTTCSSCLSGDGACEAAFTNCLGDPQCEACFANPITDGCDTNMTFQALDLCVCGNCSGECGILFGC